MRMPRVIAIAPFVLCLTPANADVTTSGLVDPATITPPLYVGQVSIGDDTQPGSLTVDNGSSLVVDNSADAGDRRGVAMRNAASTLFVSNATLETHGRTALEVYGGATVAVSNSVLQAHGRFAMEARQGATVIFDGGSQVLLNAATSFKRALNIGSSPGTSIVSADGAGTFVDLVGRINIGGFTGGGLGRLSLSNGAAAVSDFFGASTFTSFVVGNQGSAGELLINSGSELHSYVPIMQVGLGGSSGYIEVTESSVFDLTAAINIGGGGGTADIIVDNSTLTVSEDLALPGFGSGLMFVGMGPDTSTGTLTLSNGSVATIDNELHVSYQGFADSHGTGQVSVCNSTLNVPEIFVGPLGTLSGTTINGNITVNGGSIQPGCSPGKMTVTGDVVFNGGTLVVELNGPDSIDVLNVSGSTTLAEGTTVQFAFENGYAPSAGDNLDFIETTDLVLPTDPSTVSYEVEGLLDGFEFDVAPGADGLNLTANTDGAPISVDPAMDILPWLSTNYVVPGPGWPINVAILTTNDAPIFDATSVDPSTVQFGPNGASPIPRWAKRWDVDGDGDLDLLLSFRSKDTGIACGDTSATLTGQTEAGTAISASDSIQTILCH